MNRRRRHSGFTFLELLVAMAMVGILALSLYATLHTAFKARDSAVATLAPVRSVNIAMELIRHDIESALSPTGILAGSFLGQRLTDNGTADDDVQFYCVGGLRDVNDPTDGGMRKVELALVTQADGTPHMLVRRVTRNLLATVTPDPDEEVICRGVKTFQVRYYDGTDWQDDWDSTQLNNILPMAVEVTIALDDPPGAAPGSGYHSVRIFPLCCYRPASTDTTGSGTGS